MAQDPGKEIVDQSSTLRIMQAVEFSCRPLGEVLHPNLNQDSGRRYGHETDDERDGDF